jgi:hypothetical protein
VSPNPHIEADAPATPNTGRILDYWLGGSHHYPIDVVGAKQFESVYAGFPAVFGSLRNYIGRVSKQIEQAGIDQFMVLGAGLPTCGNVHEAVPASKVLYTDIDMDNVRLGKRILAGNPDVGYTYCDATDLSSLDVDEASRVLDISRPIGLVLVGATAFMPDDVLRDAMHRLHEWAPEGSLLALDFDGEALSNHQQALDLLRQIGAPLFMRNPSTIVPLLAPWSLRSPGLLPTSAWPDANVDLPATSVFMFGCIVEKTS